MYLDPFCSAEKESGRCDPPNPSHQWALLLASCTGLARKEIDIQILVEFHLCWRTTVLRQFLMPET